MSEPRSALANFLTVGRSGVPGTADVRLAEMPRVSLLQLAAWPETLAAVGQVAAQLARVDDAPPPGKVVFSQGAILMRVEPLKWWLVSPAPIDRPELAPETGALLDLSAARSVVCLRGPQAATLLNHFLPLDLRDAAFPVGAVATSAFHHVGVTLWRDETGFRLLLPRSYAATLWEMLAESATQYGLEVRPPTVLLDDGASP